MKKYCIYSFLFVLLSCSETIVVENSPANDLQAPPISGYFKKRVLIEDYTGTWCGNCVRVAYAIEKVQEETDDAVVVAIHNGNDPYDYADIQPLKKLVSPDEPFALPISRLNRTTVWMFPEVTNKAQAINLTSANCGIGIALDAAVSNGNINLDVKLNFAQQYKGLKLIVLVLENNLIHDQTNYSSYYGGSNSPIYHNYVHKHVLRSSLTPLLGQEIGDPITKNIIVGQQLLIPFSVPVPASISNAANLSFVAIVTDQNNNALNSRAVNANESQAMEQNP
jgi:thiol-disulfide isomerase/thioredoxin